MIRQITVEELPLIFPIGHAIWEEGLLPGDYIEEVFQRSWQKFYAAGVGIIFGAFQGNKLVGAIGIVLYDDLNDGKLVSVEAFWYVFKEHRDTGGYGVRLLKAYEKWAKERGVQRIAMANLVSLNDAEMHQLYLKMGYRPLDRTYIKEAA